MNDSTLADSDAIPSEEVAEELEEVLHDLQTDLSGVVGSVLVDDDGFPLVWDLKGGADPTHIATAGASIAQASNRSSEVLDFGRVSNTIMTTEKGSVGVFRVSPSTSLVLLLQPSTNNILVLIEVNKTLEKLRQVMVPGF